MNLIFAVFGTTQLRRRRPVKELEFPIAARR
jgi:hypothetical protein